MKRLSNKARKRNAESAPVRNGLLAEVGRCECCGHTPGKVGSGGVRWKLCCHEIANGSFRSECLDKRYGLLVVCWYCNSERLTDKKAWPVARQLSLLKRSRPQDFDLVAFCRLIRRADGAITESDVDQFLN